ncbi:unnamed protein product [Chironomus riparius]|uniref:Uncharacterized protein n=1 Tax=Chironomus riparius TaxID=315576 RepID=A0A9N9S4P6_9DIPT|nr:unnamed protein product [Chironomus riparius]
MKKSFLFIIYLIASLSGLSSSTDIVCDYSVTRFTVIGDVYRCSIKDNPNILTKESAKVNILRGSHWDSKSNDDVLGFVAFGITMQYFPTGLDKYFKNIKAIYIQSCQLKEIHQSDLKQFPNLISLSFYFNSIKSIEAGLFDFNPNLQLIAFLEQQIVRIDPNVFDHLNNLESFYFHLVPCVNQYIENSREEVKAAIQIVKEKCSMIYDSCTINSNYGHSSPSYEGLKDIYLCYIISDPKITSKDLADSCGISGTHATSKTNAHVHGFYAKSKTINYFPHILSKKYQNLKMITFQDCKMKEVHQSDLKPFPNLVHFNVKLNEIEVIEQGLFDFNLNLEYISFSQNNIVHIDSNVFDSLSKLRWFFMDPDSCLTNSNSVSDSIEQVVEVIKIVKSNCTNSEFLSLDAQLKNLEIESKEPNFDEFASQMESFIRVYKNSRLSKVRTLNDQFQALLNSEECPNCHQMIKLIALDKKVSKIDENLSVNQKIILNKFEDLSLTKCGLDAVELKATLSITLDSLKSLVIDQESKLDQIQNTQNQLNDNSQTEVKFDDLRASQDSSLSVLTSKLNELKNNIKESQINDNSDDKISALRFKDHFIDFEGKIDEKLERIEKKLTTKVDKMSTNLDEKVKGLESRLMKIFEEILEEKLQKLVKLMK